MPSARREMISSRTPGVSPSTGGAMTSSRPFWKAKVSCCPNQFTSVPEIWMVLLSLPNSITQASATEGLSAGMTVPPMLR